MVSLLLALERRVGLVVSALAQALLVAAVLASLWQVVSRFALSNPSDWTEVLTRTLIIWSVFLGIASAFRRGALVSVDLLRQSLKGRARRHFELALSFLAAVFLGFVCFVGSQLAWLTRFQLLIGLEIPISWAYLAIPTGCAVAILSVVAHHFDQRHEELETAL